MTDQQETSVGFVLNFAAGIAVLFALFVFSLNVTKTARNHADLGVNPAYVEMMQ